MGVIVLTAALGLVRWTRDGAHGNADVYYYARAALRLSGEPGATADAAAARFTFQMLHPGATGTYTPARLKVSADPRYAGFFAPRVLYPLIAAAGVPLLGVDALVAASWLAAAVAALAVAVAVRSGTGSAWTGLLAAALLLVSPGGRYLFWATADATMIACVAVTIAAAGGYLAHGTRSALAVLGAGLALLAGAKLGNLDVTGLALVAVGVGAAVTRAAWQARARVVAGFGAAAIAIALVGSTILGLPSIIDQIQDTLTAHFRRPDYADPILELMRRDVRFFAGRLRESIGVLPQATFLTVGLASLARWPRPWVIPWLAAAATTPLLVAVHPVRSDIDRVLAPVWLSVAVGLAVLFHRSWPGLRARIGSRMPGASIAV